MINNMIFEGIVTKIFVKSGTSSTGKDWTRTTLNLVQEVENEKKVSVSAVKWGELKSISEGMHVVVEGKFFNRAYKKQDDTWANDFGIEISSINEQKDEQIIKPEQTYPAGTKPPTMPVNNGVSESDFDFSK